MVMILGSHVSSPSYAHQRWHGNCQPEFEWSRKIYVDRMGRMDRAVYEFELESLDQFYTVLRGRYANLSPEAQRLVDSLNEHAVEGARELYEVIE